jgi:hypothetical protein
MNPTVVEKYLRAALVADATVHAVVADRIYRWPAPAGVTYPCVTYDYQGTDMDGTLGDGDALSALSYRIVVICRSSDALSLDATASRIDTLLDGVSAVQDTTVLRFTRMEDVSEPEMSNAERYETLGGVYRVWVQGTTP